MRTKIAHDFAGDEGKPPIIGSASEVDFLRLKKGERQNGLPMEKATIEKQGKVPSERKG
jgi:hypothetical protein